MTAKIDNYSFLEKELEFAKLEIANLHDDIHEWMDKCDALRAKITAMEQQEPVGYVAALFDEYVILANNFDRDALVYLAPVAPETKP